MKKTSKKELGKIEYDFVNNSGQFVGFKELSGVYKKYRGAEFAEYLKSDIIFENNNYETNNNIKCGFSRDNALTDINILYFNIDDIDDDTYNEKNDDKYFKFGIQIQGEQYKHYIIFPRTMIPTRGTELADFQENIAKNIFGNGDDARNLWFIKMKEREGAHSNKDCYKNFYGFKRNGLPHTCPR